MKANSDTANVKKSKTVKSSTVKRPPKKKLVKKKASVKKAEANIQKNPQSSESVKADVVLRQEMAVKEVRKLYQEFFKHIDHMGEIKIDASAVNKIDTASMQMLLAFVRKKQAQNERVLWLDPSVTILETARTLGLANEMGLD